MKLSSSFAVIASAALLCAGAPIVGDDVDMAAFCAPRIGQAPRLATTHPVAGRVTLDCLHAATAQRMGWCTLIEETPPGMGYADHALHLMCDRSIDLVSGERIPDDQGRARIRVVINFGLE